MGLCSPMVADSLWEYSQVQFYNQAARRVGVGDIVTIYISEATSAVQEASTRTAKESGFGSSFLTNWDQVASLLGNESIRKQHELDIQGKDQYRGSGQTSRRTKVQSINRIIIHMDWDQIDEYLQFHQVSL